MPHSRGNGAKPITHVFGRANMSDNAVPSGVAKPARRGPCHIDAWRAMSDAIDANAAMQRFAQRHLGEIILAIARH